MKQIIKTILGGISYVRTITSSYRRQTRSRGRLEASFTEDLGADSLDLFEVVMGIEEEFNVSIDNEDLEQIKTVQDAMNYIKSKQA